MRGEESQQRCFGHLPLGGGGEFADGKVMPPGINNGTFTGENNM